MKTNRLFVLPLALALTAAAPALASDADRIAALEESVAALEERVAALESGVPAGVTSAPEQETADAGDVDTGIISNNCSLNYIEWEIGKDYKDNDCLILYFDFVNGSGDTTTATKEFGVDVFQNGKELEITGVTGNEASKARDTKLRSGADALRVAYPMIISDTSDVIVSLYSRSDRKQEAVEFNLSLQ